MSKQSVQMDNIFLAWSSGTGVRVSLTAILAIAAATCCSAVTTCTSSTVNALLEFRSAFHDPNGKVFSSWNNNADCCTWAGITCQNGALVVLDVEGPLTATVTSNRSYSGKPGHTLSKLKDLQTLKLKNLQFSSKIPSQWSSFSDSLVAITVNNCDLRDSIPSGIASNSRLQTLDLKSNNLSGKIPSKLCDLQELKYLDLSYNELDTGSVPDCITNSGSITNVNYGHQSTNSENDASGPGGSGSYSPHNSASRTTSLFFQSNAMIFLLPPIFSLLQYHSLV